MKIKKAFLALLLVVSILSGIIYEYLSAQTQESLVVGFIDVGQGDAVFIASGGATMLIDTGERGHAKRIMDFIRTQGFSRIDFLVGTHPHSDHIGGMAEIIRNFEVVEILMPRVQHNTRTFENTLDAIIDRGLTVHSPEPGESFELGSAVATVVAPSRIVQGNMNNNSIVIRLVFDDFAFLFMGDAESALEAEMIAGANDISSNVIKIGHHGSSTSTEDSFLRAVSPEIAVITVGANNRYGHPSDIVLQRLASAGVEVYRTDIHGNIVMRVTSDELRITTERTGEP